VHEAGVDEVACLIDFGLDNEAVLHGLERLAAVRHRLVAAPPENAAASFGTLMHRHQAANFQCTPSLAGALIHDPAAVAGFKRLDRLIVGGEPLARDLARELSAHVPAVFHTYGPTEATVWATIQDLATAGDGGTPIGLPLAGTAVYVVDDSLRLAPVGVAGELCLGGNGIGRGYAGRPDLTAERFVPDPFSDRAGARLYRTGDRVRWRCDRVLEFLGRADDQVKIRGVRVEPGEVRAAINAHPAVCECYVAADAPNGQGTRLIAWLVRDVTAAGDGNTSAEGLRDFLHQRLPAYMVPSEMVWVDAIPLTPNGKIDVLALRQHHRLHARRPERVMPRTDTESLLMRVFADVLARDQIGIDDNFFQLGGHSLLAMHAMFRIRRETGLALSLDSLFEAQTIRDLARLIDILRWIPPAPAAGPEQSEDTEAIWL
jgi:acyl-CoA synthetase (AMP-forming)/AMP-acid ligase II